MDFIVTMVSLADPDVKRLLTDHHSGLSARVCVCVFVGVYVFMCARVCTCVIVCEHVCVYLCVRVRALVCVCLIHHHIRLLSIRLTYSNLVQL